MATQPDPPDAPDAGAPLAPSGGEGPARPPDGGAARALSGGDDPVGPAALEAERLALQARLDAARPAAERNRRGQYATPPGLAGELVDAALQALARPGPLRFLDPALGTGALWSALWSALGARRGDGEAVPTGPGAGGGGDGTRAGHGPAGGGAEGVAEALGVELDPTHGGPAAALWAGTGLRVELADFTRLPPRPVFDLVVANPPYVRHHHLDAADKARLVAVSSAALGAKVSGLAGLHVHVVFAAHAWMAPGAVGAWLLPAEWLDTRYGAALRRYLAERVTLLRLHRADLATAEFADALVSTAVVLLRNAPPPPGHRVQLSAGGRLSTPAHAATLPLATLAAATRWGRLLPRGPERGADVHDRGGASPPGPHGGAPGPHGPGGPAAAPTPPRPSATSVRLGELFTVRRGLATGDNALFILPEARVRALGLWGGPLRPILPGPRRLDLDEVCADADGLPLGVERRFLIDTALGEAELRERWPALWAWLEAGAPRAAGRHLCRHRRPWYRQEQRPPAPLLCTYMGRGAGGAGPFRFVRNHSLATAANTWLLLHPRPGVGLEQVHAAWQHLRALPPEALCAEGRVYGGALHKLEPTELAEVRVGGV